MEIHGDQILVQFKTYGAPQVVTDYFEANDVDVAELDTRTIPAHGVAAVKELMAYTTGLQVVLAIAAIALGQMDEPVVADPDEPDGDAETSDQDEDATDDVGATDSKDVPIVEGARVVIITEDEDGGSVEGGGSIGEVESIELRGAEHIVSLTTDPEPGHTTGNLIAVRASLLEVLPA